MDKPAAPKDTLVVPFLRVVANGVAPVQKGDTPRLKATLVVTPEPSTTGVIELRNWPDAFAAHIRKGGAPASAPFTMTLFLRQVGAADGPVLGDAHSVQAAVVAHATTTAEDWAGATRAWQAALHGQGDGSWRDLADDIRRSLTGQKRKADPQSSYGPPATPPADRFDTDGAILADAPTADQRATIKGIVPVRHGQFAIDEERVRAARVLAKMATGPQTLVDDAVLEIAGKASGDFAVKLKQEHYKAFVAAVGATDGERCDSKATFTSVKTLIKGEAGEAPKPSGMRESPTLLPPADRVRTGNAGKANRASHTYGNWLQRRANLKTETGPDGIVPAPAGSSDPCASDAADDASRAHGIFYAFQGDPILSRLFCLTVDLEFNLPKELWHPDRPVFLQLSAEQAGGTGRCTPVVATAARLSGRSFWPASVFEAGVHKVGDEQKRIDEPSLVEQRDGFWRLDPGYAPENPANHAPRYDLTSLDIRRSVDAKPDGMDRGQRQLTAGFTLLDHGRGAQVARDLALADVNAPSVANASTGCEPRPTVVLHAEELTIGRHVDLASAGSGTAVAKLEWRSLMSRLVRYEGFDKAAQNLMSHLIKERDKKGRFTDEASFQVAARLMPIVHETGQANEIPLEAVAEEAIFLWDGTPASVLTEAGPGAQEQGKELPFTRLLEPPSAGNGAAALRPAPLRYGASYLFRLRSMFLGGGSPPSDATMSSNDGGAMLPPAAKGLAVPRRFLRHESVLPPILLLPRHLATASLDPMGFELADQAIVRSSVDADQPPKTANPEPGPGDLPVAPRARPKQTTRVFIVPEASPETLGRHGKLPDDLNARKAVLRGGLRDVAFDPVEMTDTPARKATGFPTVITRRLQGFGSEGVDSERTVSRGNGDEIGIPVFEPGGGNTTKPGQIGYLPDPSVEQMSVRLRVRRSGLYLDGGMSVDVYEPKAGIRFPHALPLVVTVRCSEKDRDELADAIDQVIAEDGRGLRWMSPSGVFSKGRPLGGKAVRVRHLVLDLCRGEDFDLEVACLPSAETFARTFSLPETVAMQLAQVAVDKRARADLERLVGPIETAPFTVKRPTSTLCGFTGLAGLRVPSGGAVLRAAEQILATMTDIWPLEEVAALATLRVCHAVNAPPAPAEDVFSALRARRPAVPDSEKDAGWADHPDHDDRAGEKTLLLTGTLKLDLERVDAFELVATSVAASARVIDDRNRSRSLIERRSGRWPKLTTDDGSRRYVAPRFVVGFDVDAQSLATFSTETVTLLRVGNLPARAAEDVTSSLFGKREGRLTPVCLGRLFASAIVGRPISLPVDGDAPAPTGTGGNERRHVVSVCRPHIIADTRARRLQLSVVTLSRSAEAFETAPRYGKGRPTLNRRQALQANDQSRTSQTFDLWVPSTARPPVCEVRRPEIAPVITRRADAVKDGTVQVVRREVMTRLYLKRGWDASGEGERLGVVLWPPLYFEQAESDIDADRVRADSRPQSIASFDDGDLGPGGTYATRWGGDPIGWDAQPQRGFLIPPGAFADAAEGCLSPHKPQVVGRAKMPVRRSARNDETGEDAASGKGDCEAFLEVTLLTFEPCFDLDREEWYVDIDLKPIRAAQPFVRFGLVRYQENAITEELKVSYPISVQAQVMPTRELHVAPCTCPQGKRSISVTLKGAGSLGIAPLNIEVAFRDDPNLATYLASFAKLAKPEVRVTVFHENAAETGLLLRTRLSQSETWVSTSSSLDVSDLVWNARVPVTDERVKQLGPGTLVAYVEEIDRRMPSSYQTEPIRPETMFDERTFRESGPRFSARVPFLEVT